MFMTILHPQTGTSGTTQAVSTTSPPVSLALLALFRLHSPAMADIRDYLDELLPPGTTDEQVDAAILHISNAWWPQLCHSSRNSLIDCNLFEDAWYDVNDLLDIHNPAYGTIVKALVSTPISYLTMTITHQSSASSTPTCKLTALNVT